MYGLVKYKKNGLQDSLKNILGQMLDKGLVEAVMVPKRVKGGNNYVQVLITDPGALKDISPVSPVMPVNTAKLISDMTKLGGSARKVAVVLKPCEMRALVELVKLNQATLENIITISMDCYGTYSVTDLDEMVKGNKEPENEYLRSVQSGRDVTGVRSACRVCDNPVSDLVDLNLCLASVVPRNELTILANTTTGETILAELGLKGKDITVEREKKLQAFLKPRLKARDRMMDELKKTFEGDTIAPLQEFFSTCISCRNCVSVCPICYCRECFFESATFEYESQRYFRSVDKKGSIKMPTDTLLFHITRFAHMVTSCVACGMCEQACPSGIPLLSIYKSVGFKAQEEFDYVPGRDLDEEMPLSTFKEEEYEPL
jgi:formate dehydrogenase subunit beta